MKSINSRHLDALTACRDNDDIYLFGCEKNLLYKLNIKSGRTVLLGSIPERKITEERLIGKILKWNSKIILLPLYEKNVWIYDLETDKWEKIEIADTENLYALFYQGFIYNDILHMIGCYYPAIVRIDLVTLEMEYDSRMFSEIDRIPSVHDKIYFRSEYIREGNSIMMGCCNVNRIMRYDLDTFDYSLLEVGAADDDFEGLSVIEGGKIMAGRHNRCVYFWKENLLKKQFPPNIDNHYMATIRKEGKYELISSTVGESCVINGDKFEKIKVSCLFCEKQDLDNYIFMSDTGVLTVCDDSVISEYCCQMSENDFNRIILLAFHKICDGEILKESSIYNLEFFINVLKADSLTGESMYEMVAE